jgi:hypothetical protein
MTRQILGWIMLAAVLLILIGLLLGATWTTQALQSNLRHRAEERRRLNEEWAAVRATRHYGQACPYCAYPLTDQDWYGEESIVEEPSDDD